MIDAIILKLIIDDALDAKGCKTDAHDEPAAGSDQPLTRLSFDGTPLYLC